MKENYLLVFLLASLLSCDRNDKNAGPGNSVATSVEKQAMGIAADYARNKFKDAKETVLKNVIIISDNQISYTIDAAKVLIGLIDEDSIDDAIVPIDSYRDNNLVLTQHLILIKVNGKLKIVKVIESDMKIFRIKNRVIYVEIPTHPRSSPLYNCSECKEVAYYQFRKDSLIRME
jgi:hypothetical protein